MLENDLLIQYVSRTRDDSMDNVNIVRYKFVLMILISVSTLIWVYRVRLETVTVTDFVDEDTIFEERFQCVEEVILRLRQTQELTSSLQ